MSINPQIGSSLIGAGTGLISNVIGAFSNAANNRTQMQIAQENRDWQSREQGKQNAWNAAQTDKQNQWNLDQWNRENQYNSAASQKQRYLDAGINPYMAMNNGGGSAGAASSLHGNAAQGASMPGAPNMPNTQAFRPDVSGIQDALSNMFVKDAQIKQLNSQVEVNGKQSAYISSQTEGQVINNEHRKIMNPKEQESADWHNKNESEVYEQNKAKTEVDTATTDIKIAQEKEMLNLKTAQTALTNLDAESKRIINEYLPAQQAADLALKYSHKVELITRANLNDAQRAKAYKEIESLAIKDGLTIAETTGKKIDNYKMARTMGSFIQSTIATNLAKQVESDNQRFKNSFTHKSNLGGLWGGIDNTTRYLGNQITNILPILK